MGRLCVAAADQMVALVKLTPHRVMRELYEQFIAYSRVYADRIPTYTHAGRSPCAGCGSAANTVGDICSAVSYDSASGAGTTECLGRRTAPSQVAPWATLPARNASFRTQPRLRGVVDGLVEFRRDTADGLSITLIFPPAVDAGATRDQ